MLQRAPTQAPIPALNSAPILSRGRLAALGLLLGFTVSACDGTAPAASSDSCDEPGMACTWAGVKGSRGFNGDGIDRREAWFGFVSDLTFAPDGRAWLLDWNNHRVRRVEADQTLSTVIGTDYEGDGPPGQIDRLPEGDPEGAPATTVALNHPTDIEFLSDGTVVLAAWHNNKIRIMDADTGIVTVVAGDGYGYTGDEGPAYRALFNQPKALAIDARDRIYTNDQRNQRIRRIDDADPPRITTIAGTGVKGFSGDGGPALQAQFSWDQGVTPLPSGSLVLDGDQLYVADSLNHRIRHIDLETGLIDTIAGNGVEGHSGDGGPAVEASFNQPLDIELGPDGRLYVADTFNNVIRAINLETGIVEHVAGNGHVCERSINCYEADDLVAAEDLQLSEPYGIAFDATGALYIADTNNSRIVRTVP